MRALRWSLGLLVVCTAALHAGRPAPPSSLEAVPLAGAGIVIDGQLDEPIWSTAPGATEFLQREPSEGAAPSHPTDVRVAFDATALYVAVRATEPDAGEIRGHLTRRDDNSPSDWIRVLVDSYYDRRTAYEFSVNAAGVKQDNYWFNDNNNDDGWDAVWDAAVARSADGWRAEFKIPLSQLRFNPSSAGQFGFAVVRNIAHKNETVTWPLLAKSASGYVSSFGQLSGVLLNGATKKFEVMPYVVAQAKTSPVTAGNPLEKSPDPSGSVGLDMKAKVGAGLTLTGTINPDFGQVEADPAVVNLDGFETFFSERRPFFVEGSGNFSSDMELFYSRRIGRAPHRFVGAPESGYAIQPDNTTILGAAKLTGRIGQFSIGALNAVTRAEHASVVSGAGLARSTSPVEPATNYSIVRASREFKDNSRVGFMVTSTNRALADEMRPTLAGSAVTGGVDSDWRLRDGRYSIRSHWAGSTVRGSATAIRDLQQSYVHSFARPDAGHVSFDPTRTRLDGHAGGVSFNKIAGRKLRGNASLSFKSPGYDTNDLGYLQRADDISTYHWWQFIRDTPTTHVRSFRFNVNHWQTWNFDGDQRSLGLNVNAHWEFTNNWETGTGFNMNRESFDDRLTRGGPGGYVPGNVSQWGYVTSDDRKPVRFNVFANWFRGTQGGRAWGASPSVSIRPSSSLQAEIGVDMSRSHEDAQWVTSLADPAAGPTGGKHYVFGELNQTTVGISLRFNYTLTPNLSVQLYGQPFVSSGAYSRYRELVDGRAASYADRYAPFAYHGNPDFNYHSFRTTNVLRWEYRPGSVMFIVWQQGRDATTAQGDFQFNRDFGRAFTTPGQNVFLVKFSRWLNF
jgi:hypothetical protein